MDGYQDDDMIGDMADEEEDERWHEPQDDTAVSQMVPKISGKSELGQSSSSSEPVNLMALNTNKAGMEGLDKEKINRIIMEASKGSRFYENEKKKEVQVNQRVEQMRIKMSKLTEKERRSALMEVDRTVQELEDSRDLSRTIVHLDMDAFYAAVEERDDPSLKGKPMAVGGSDMLSTSNYHARKFGVRAAMPGFIGKKLCPKLIIVPQHFDRYREVSGQVREILAEYDPNFCPMSLDEAYMDLTEHMVMRQDYPDAKRTFAKYVKRQENSPNDAEENKGKEKVTHEAVDKHSYVSKSVPPSNESGNQSEEGSSEVKVEEGSSEVKVEQGSSEVKVEQGSSEVKVEGSSEVECEEESSEVKVEEGSSEVKVEEGSSVVKVEEGSSEVKVEGVTFGLSIEDAVNEIRFRIQQKTQLTASAGIAPNCMLAKICSDKNKPNGQYRIQPVIEVVKNFIQNLPIRKVSGIGKVTERMLSALGIQTCADLYRQRALLHLLFSDISSHHFLRISLGLGSTHVERDSERKSMSKEWTFGEISKPDDLFNKCRELCEGLAEDLAQAELKGKTVGIKIKTVKYELKTRAFTVPSPVSSSDELFNVAKTLLQTEIRTCHPEPLRLRLMGVRLSSLESKGKSSNRQDTITKFFKKKESAQQPKPSNNSISLNLHPDNCNSFEQSLDNNLANIERTESCLPSNGRVATSTATTSHNCVQNSATTPHNCVQNSTAISESVFESKCNTASTVNFKKFNTPGTSMGVRSETSNNSTNFVCPVCYKVQPASNMKVFNQHVDRCLDTFNDTSAINERIEENANIPCSSATDSSSRTSTLVCPICNKEQHAGDLEAFNRHVDVCLNKGAIKEILHEQAKSDSQEDKRKSTSPTKAGVKRSAPGQQSAAKRRKQEKKPGSTLHKFFNSSS